MFYYRVIANRKRVAVLQAIAQVEIVPVEPAKMFLEGVIWQMYFLELDSTVLHQKKTNINTNVKDPIFTICFAFANANHQMIPTL